MKKIEAFIRHEAFEPIRMELLEKGFPSLSVGQYRGSGRQKGITEHYRGSELVIHLRPKMKLEIVVDDKDVGLVKETILRHARTGEVGDGKIFVLPVEEAIRIRTGEAGDEVLQAHEAGEIPAGVYEQPRRRSLRPRGHRPGSRGRAQPACRTPGPSEARANDQPTEGSTRWQRSTDGESGGENQGGRAGARRGARHPVHPALVHRHPRPAEELRRRHGRSSRTRSRREWASTARRSPASTAIEESDMIAMPDPSTFAILPGGRRSRPSRGCSATS